MRCRSAVGSRHHSTIVPASVAVTVLVLLSAIAATGDRGARTGAAASGSAQVPGALDGVRARNVGRADRAASGADRLADECGSPNPFLVSTRFVDDVHGGNLGAVPVVFTFRDTQDDLPADQVPLATYAQIGATYGLAFDASRQHLYAGAYVRRGTLFPPGGPGAITRIDLATRTVPPSSHSRRAPPASIACPQRRRRHHAVGRPAGLGDIDVDPGGTRLFAANLFDGRIYRLALPDGTVLGSFAHGGIRTRLGRRRPRLRPRRPRRSPLPRRRRADRRQARRGPSRSGTSTVRARTAPSCARSPCSASTPSAPTRRSCRGRADRPVVSDIEIRPDGDMVVAVRNLVVDTTFADVPARLGDLLPGVAEGEAFRIVLAPEQYADSLAGLDEAFTGGLALLPGLDLAVSVGNTAVGGTDADTAAWFDGATGEQAWLEPLAPDADPGAVPVLPGAGDVEVLCPPTRRSTPTESRRRPRTAPASPPARPPPSPRASRPTRLPCRRR